MSLVHQVTKGLQEKYVMKVCVKDYFMGINELLSVSLF